MVDKSSMSNEPWRIFRIMAEFVEGFDLMARTRPAVSIFGSARLNRRNPYYKMAMVTAEKLARAGYTIVTGGGPGIMEAANRGAKKGGGLSMGLNIDIPAEQESNKYLDETMEFRYFFCRKTMFVRYASAMVIMPGGFGTMDELFESLTLIQTHRTAQFPVVLMGSKYWRGLLRWVKSTMVEEGTISKGDLDILNVTDDPDETVRIITGTPDEYQGVILPG